MLGQPQPTSKRSATHTDFSLCKSKKKKRRRPLDYASQLGTPDGFQAGVGVELLVNMLNVVVDRSAADMKLPSDSYSRGAFRQHPQNFQLPGGQLDLANWRSS